MTGNGSGSVWLPMILKKIEAGHMIQSLHILLIFADSSYFTILDLGSYFNKCMALFLGLNGHLSD